MITKNGLAEQGREPDWVAASAPQAKPDELRSLHQARKTRFENRSLALIEEQLHRYYANRDIVANHSPLPLPAELDRLVEESEIIEPSATVPSPPLLNPPCRIEAPEKARPLATLPPPFNQDGGFWARWRWFLYATVFALACLVVFLKFPTPAGNSTKAKTGASAGARQGPVPANQVTPDSKPVSDAAPVSLAAPTVDSPPEKAMSAAPAPTPALPIMEAAHAHPYSVVQAIQAEPNINPPAVFSPPETAMAKSATTNSSLGSEQKAPEKGQVPSVPEGSPAAAAPLTSVAKPPQTQATDGWQNPYSPIFRRYKKPDGTMRFALFDFPGVLFPKSVFVNRYISPCLALWSTEKNAEREASRQELLWRLYCRAASPAEKKLTFVFGLYHVKETADGSKTARFLGIPIWDSARTYHYASDKGAIALLASTQRRLVPPLVGPEDPSRRRRAAHGAVRWGFFLPVPAPDSTVSRVSRYDMNRLQ